MHYFVHFTLVVTLVTVQGTLAERSEVHSKGTGESQCIKSLDELINAFRRRETITGNHTNLMDDSTTIFDMKLEYLLTYTMMFLTYQVSFSGNTTSYQCPVGASACCTPLDRESHLPLQSHTVMLYQSEIFGIFPAPLLALGSPLNVILVSSFKHTNLGLMEYCWSPPAFCKGVLSYQIAGMLSSFSIAVSCNSWLQHAEMSNTTHCSKTAGMKTMLCAANGTHALSSIRQNTYVDVSRQLQSLFQSCYMHFIVTVQYDDLTFPLSSLQPENCIQWRSDHPEEK